MEYFETLNLRREPFSSSPDPDMFYRSSSQLECLRQLEIAIRLRRGLNVVLGEVGTGKTTICRQLLRELAHGGDIFAGLILDPGFDDSAAFVLHLSQALGVVVESGACATHVLMENIKSHLFDVSAVQRRIVCLVIDEGQKMSPECLEILRELLNYETNEFKLLQIAIFAQAEFMERLLAQPNLADRVNYFHSLVPFTFLETRGMIAARLSLAAASGAKPPRFSFTALYVLHKRCRGYPRKIIWLCHRALLSIIERGARNIGVLDVMRTARSLNPRRETASSPWKWAALSATLLLILVWSVFAVTLGPEEFLRRFTEDLPARIADWEISLGLEASRRGPPAGPEIAPGKTFGQRDAGVAVSLGKTASRILGKAAVMPGWTLGRLLEALYGRRDQAVLTEMARANPEIRNIADIGPDVQLVFPAIVVGPPPQGLALVRLAQMNSLVEAFAYLSRNYRLEQPLKLLACTGPDGRMRFAVILAKTTLNRQTAEKALANLPPELSAHADIVSEFEPQTIYYTDFSGEMGSAPQSPPAAAEPKGR